LLRLKGGVYNFPVECNYEIEKERKKLNFKISSLGYESYRKPFGGVITGKECCDPFTVSFH